MERDGANPAHPLNKFATGNKFTLETNAKAQGIDIREKLFEYYKQFYSANIMTLSVIGNQDVKTLEKWVRQRFADVPNRNAVAPNYAWWGKIAPYPSQKAAVALEIVPIGQLRSVSVSWPIWVRSPQERAAMLTAKPDVVVSHLLGHEGVGSLWSYLIKKGWGNEVQAAVGNEVSDMLMFDVSVDLTEEGFKHRYDVVKAIFAYIDLLKSRPIPSYIYSELEQLSYIGFNFAEKSEASSFASSLVENMQLFPTPKDYLVGPRLFNAPDPAQVGKLVDQLTPAAAMLKVISSDFEGKTKLKAKYYATNYNNITLERQTKEWERTSIGQYPELSLPPPNELIPTNFDLIVPPAQSEAAAIKALDIPPKIIRSDDRWTLWHKIDNSFKQPKAYVVLTLAVPQSLYDVDFVVNTKLFTYSFMDSINEYLYDARLAGLGFQLDFTSKGVQIVLSGYNDKLALFAERVCTALKTYEPDEPTYQRMRDLLLREYNSWTAQQPYFHASYFSALATETLNYPIPEMKAALARVSRASLKDFLTVSLGRSYGTAIAIGNLDEKAAIELTAIVEKSFPFAPLKRSERAIRQIVELPATGTLAEVALSGDSSTYDGLRISRQEPNQNDENSAVSVYYQMESPLPERYVLLELLADIIEQPFFNSLRTQQQLGYIVFCGVRNRERARYLTFTVQSSLIGGSEITDRILDFVRTNVLSALEKLPEEELAQFKQGIAAKKLEPDQRLTSHASRLWSEIVFANYYNTEEKANIPMFDRAKAEVAALNKINKKALIAFAKDFLLSANKRVLVTEVTSAKAPAAQARSPSEFVAISDEAKFQQESRKL